MVSIIVLLMFVYYSGCDEADFISSYRGESEINEEDAPFVLGQNYPNPFNGTTRIEFSVAYHLKLKLTVFSDEWQAVNVLLERPVDFGIYSIQFDGKNLPSGDYYYMLEGAGYRQIRKMKLVK